jgi:hypothetical protein
MAASLMDASLILAVDGLKAVTAACADSAMAHAGESGDRTVLAMAGDVEEACNAVLGLTSKAEGGRDGKSARAKRRILPFLPRSPKPSRGEGLLAPARAGSASGGDTAGAGRGSSSGGGTAGNPAFSRSITLVGSHLAPVTEIIVLHAGDPVPQGFARIEWSVTGAYPADLNAVRSQVQRWLWPPRCVICDRTGPR